MEESSAFKDVNILKHIELGGLLLREIIAEHGVDNRGGPG